MYDMAHYLNGLFFGGNVETTTKIGIITKELYESRLDTAMDSEVMSA